MGFYDASGTWRLEVRKKGLRGIAASPTSVVVVGDKGALFFAHDWDKPNPVSGASASLKFKAAKGFPADGSLRRVAHVAGIGFVAVGWAGAWLSVDDGASWECLDTATYLCVEPYADGALLGGKGTILKLSP